jgi:hypothetical protein
LAVQGQGPIMFAEIAVRQALLAGKPVAALPPTRSRGD